MAAGQPFIPSLHSFAAETSVATSDFFYTLYLSGIYLTGSCIKLLLLPY